MAVTTDMVKFYYGAALPEVGIETNALYFIPSVGLYKGNQLIANATQITEGSAIADAIQTMINTSISKLGNTINFLGRTSTAITDGEAQIPTIGDKTIPLDDLEAGDVVLYDNQEFIWTIEKKWELFGDEGSYALKTEVQETYATKDALAALEKALKTDGTIVVQKAAYAETAGNADSASEANHAVSADSASEANHAVSADSAQTAGSAESANKANSLNVDDAIGSDTQPVYINKDGEPVAIRCSIETSVPANADFENYVTGIEEVTGSGNAITGITAQNGKLILTKGTEFVATNNKDYVTFTEKANDAYTALCWNTI